MQSQKIPNKISIKIKKYFQSIIPGNVILWGRYDVPLPGMPPQSTHIRILRIHGFKPPPSFSKVIYGIKLKIPASVNDHVLS